MPGVGLWRRLYERKDSDGQADLEIICGPYIHKVHGLVVSTASPYFRIACTESSRGGIRKTIRMTDDDPVAVSALIRFLYLEDYVEDLDHADCSKSCQKMQKAATCASNLCLHARVYGLGEQCNVPEIKLVAQRYFKASLGVKQIPYETLRAAVGIAYEDSLTEDFGLRNIVLDSLVDRANYMPKEDFQRLISDIPGLACDVSLKFFQAIKKTNAFIVETIMEHDEELERLRERNEYLEKINNEREIQQLSGGLDCLGLNAAIRPGE